MGRAPCCDKTKVKRGPWSPEEDATLKNYVHKYGTGGNWITLPNKAGLKRCGKSCRLRWLNYLRPDIKHGGFTKEEDDLILTLFHRIGSRWSVIASHLPGRTDNDVKNYWNTKLKKKLTAEQTTAPSTSAASAAAGNNNNLSPSPLSVDTVSSNYPEYWNNLYENKVNPDFHPEVINSRTSPIFEENEIPVQRFIENDGSDYWGLPLISEEYSSQLWPSFLEDINPIDYAYQVDHLLYACGL